MKTVSFKRRRSKKQNNVNEIDWSKRTEKRDNDMYLNKYIKPLMHRRSQEGKPVNCLSFPAAKWIWETNLARSFSANSISFYGVERSPLVNKAASRTAKSLMASRNKKNYTMTLMPPEIDFAKAICRKTGVDSVDSINGFDIIYADYMGTWSENCILDIQSMLSGSRSILKSFGILVITLMLSRGEKRLRSKTLALADSMDPSDRVGIDDDHLYDRLLSDTYSMDVHPLAVGISETIVRTARSLGSVLIPHPVHIYYSPGASPSVMSQPEASFCFTKLT